MGIVAFCPHGHRIKVKDQLAGRKGICPTCQSRFRIPLRQAPVEPAARRDGAVGLPTARALSFDPHVVAMLPAALEPAGARDADAAEPDVDVAEADVAPETAGHRP